MPSEVFTDARFDEAVVASPKPVLVDFWAPWCGPCRMLGPVIEQLADEFGGRVVVGKLNVDEHPLTARRFGVRSIPTLILFRAGVAVERIVGAEPKDALVAAIERSLAAGSAPAS